ncbi:siphovirus ReqiPepy6 Gp37-like family protein [Streptomyces sp. GMY02]|uniref:siphovirus ReqiPepy6 Gp37-like family protein n=1 Tax=Streptomyces sp. GMY02 TaxID=1333528 RepID=UPI00349F168A
MKLADLTVEVRDKTLTRIGLIRPEDLAFEVANAFNNVGTWKLTMASEHPLASALRTPGAGLIVTGPGDVLISGPVVSSQYAATPEDRRGSIVFDGVSDSVILADILAWPQPSNPDVTTQAAGHDERTGPAETLMHAYVSANCGPLAPAARRKAGLIMGVDQGRGPVISKSARFPTLGELLTAIAVVADLGFRIVQRGSQLVFETYQVIDRTKEVRLDVLAGSLAGQRVSVSTPGATRVIVAGQGAQVDRTFVPVDNTTSVGAEEDWGRRIERFVDQRNTDNLDELTQAGNEVLADEGFTATAVQAVPVEDSTAEFGVDWGLGDRVTVIAGGEELTAPVTGMVIKANDSGFQAGALLGDPNAFDPNSASGQRSQSTEQRVSALERTSEGGGTGGTPGPQGPKGDPGVIQSVNGFSAPSITLTAADVGASPAAHTHTAAQVGAIATTARGTANGVASLDGAGKVPLTELPEVFLPSDLGLKSWAFDPGLGMSDYKYPSSGSLRITAVPIHATTTVSKIVWHVFGYAGGLLAGSNAGIFNSAGTRVALVGDMTGETKLPGVHNIGGATVAAPLTASVSLPPGIYYVAWWFKYTTSPIDGPALLVADSAASAPPGRFGLNNVHRFGVIGSVSSFPSTLNFAAFEGGPNRFWVALAA